MDEEMDMDIRPEDYGEDEPSGSTAFADLFELTKEILRTENYVLREAHLRTDPKTKCLVKCLFTFGLSTADREAMAKEMKLYRRIRHEYIVSLEEVVAEPEDRFWYLLYEDMPGGALAELLGSGRQFSEDEVKIMIKRILEALVYLHEGGISHGHLTPSRILFSRDMVGMEGAASAKLCFMDQGGAVGNLPEGDISELGEEYDGRDKDILSLGLVALSALMGDPGAAGGEPLESLRATEQSIGLPDLTPHGRDILGSMLGTEVSQDIPSAKGLLLHPWFNPEREVEAVDGGSGSGIETETPLPLQPGQQVAIGPPVTPEPMRGAKGTVTKTQAPIVVRGAGGGLPQPPRTGSLGGSLRLGEVGAGGSNGGEGGPGGPGWVGMPDGSQVLCAWLSKRSNERNKIGLRPWHKRWFVLNPSSTMLVYYTAEVDLVRKEGQQGPLGQSHRRSSGSVPKAIPLNAAKISRLIRPRSSSESTHEHCLHLEDELERFPAMLLSFPSEELMGVWEAGFAMVKEPAPPQPPPPVVDTPRQGPPKDREFDDWWDGVSHQAQRVAHVSAMSAAVTTGGEEEMGCFVEEKLLMHKRSTRSLNLNGSIKSGGTSVFGGGSTLVLPSANNAGTIFKNSALHWEHRAEELAAITSSGKPILTPIRAGERWFIIDSRWMDHWLEFCMSKRRMAPPGPVDNSWMLHTDKRYTPYQGLTLAVGKSAGDYRRVGPEVWEHFMRIYGGGPAIYVDGPPVEDLSRWVVRYGHQIARDGKGGRQSSRRHIPNPGVSTEGLRQAAYRWSGLWDKDMEDDIEEGSYEDVVGGGGLSVSGLSLGRLDEEEDEVLTPSVVPVGAGDGAGSNGGEVGEGRGEEEEEKL